MYKTDWSEMIILFFGPAVVNVGGEGIEIFTTTWFNGKTTKWQIPKVNYLNYWKFKI